MFDEVLPTIRRHGMYAYDELLADDEFLEHAIATLRAERAKRLAAEQALLETAPKVSYYDVVLQSDSLLTTTAIAKDYGLSAKKLNRILRDAHVQFVQSGRWFLYANLMLRFGYPSNLNNGERMWACWERTTTHYWWLSQFPKIAGCNFGGGSSGGPWLDDYSNSTGLGHVRSVTSFGPKITPTIVVHISMTQ